MKRTREVVKADRLCFNAAPNGILHPSLARHLATPFAQSARYSDSSDRYEFRKAGNLIQVGGLINTLRYRFYPNYEENRSKRKWKTVKIKGSTAAQGKKVDSQISASIVGPVKKMHPMAARLLAYWKEHGQTLQAGQVPVEIPGWLKMTQADLITRDEKTGKLWLWEIKTGASVGFHHKQGNMSGTLAKVECKKLNIWHLQLHYTRLALEAAGVEIAESRVIQIHEEKGLKGFVVKVYSPPEWTTMIPSFIQDAR